MCDHKNTTLLTTGGFHFSAGEVWDDIEETVICLDCGEEVQPQPVEIEIQDEAEILF